MSVHRHRANPFLGLFGLLAALVLLLASCGDSSESGTTSFDQGGAAPEPEGANSLTDDVAPEATSPATGDVETTGEGDFGLDSSNDAVAQEPEEPSSSIPANDGSGFAIPLFVGREIIFTADVVVESDDVPGATADVIAAVLRNGGAIWGQDSRTDPAPQTVLTIRVPPGAPFEQVLEAIGGLQGTHVVSQTVTTDDVTEVVVDLDARILAAEAGVDRIQQRLDDTTDLTSIFTLEEELATRQANLERLRGQRKTIGDQITLATITLTIVELDPDRLAPEMAVVAWVGDDVDDACPGVSDLSIGADDSAVLCVNVSNTGEDTLTEIDIQSPTFRLRVNDFTVHQGGAEIGSLAPGEELLVYAELEADGGFINRVDASSTVRIDIAVTAVPSTTPTIELEGIDSVFISADVDDPLPGFTDSFSSGWGAMVAVVSVLMIGLGFLLPLIPFILVAAWLGRKAMARSRERADARAAYVEAYVASTTPTPPPPPTT